MKVRATADGTYGGYYRIGPIIGDQGSFPGEVFEIDDRMFPVLDIEGKPVFELDADGKVILDPKTRKPQIKMGSWFSPTWMEKVSDNTEITYDYPPFQIPVQYRAKKATPQPQSGGVAPSSVI
jgi:hypothetical protein